MLTTRRITLGLLAGFLMAGTAAAQAPSRRLRGTIESLDGSLLVVRTADASVPVTLAPNVGVTAMSAGTLADIVPGAFIGVVGIGPANAMKAINVAIFPESARGAGEGHREWDTLPDSTMTNATVDADVASSDGRTLKLTAKGETYTAAVTPQTVVVKNGPGTLAMLKPGAWVFLTVQPNESGMLTTPRVAVGVDGFAPPL